MSKLVDRFQGRQALGKFYVSAGEAKRVGSAGEGTRVASGSRPHIAAAVLQSPNTS